jgi:hypothetical protein
MEHLYAPQDQHVVYIGDGFECFETGNYRIGKGRFPVVDFTLTVPPQDPDDEENQLLIKEFQRHPYQCHCLRCSMHRRPKKIPSPRIPRPLRRRMTRIPIKVLEPEYYI